jgi:hypothetical protein
VGAPCRRRGKSVKMHVAGERGSVFVLLSSVQEISLERDCNMDVVSNQIYTAPHFYSERRTKAL